MISASGFRCHVLIAGAPADAAVVACKLLVEWWCGGGGGGLDGMCECEVTDPLLLCHKTGGDYYDNDMYICIRS